MHYILETSIEDTTYEGHSWKELLKGDNIHQRHIYRRQYWKGKPWTALFLRDNNGRNFLFGENHEIIIVRDYLWGTTKEGTIYRGRPWKSLIKGYNRGRF